MTETSKDLSIIIPCYNEEDSLPLLLDKLAPFLEVFPHKYELIFVNDGSTDKTVELINKLFKEKYPIKLISYEKNRNLGGAVKEGILHISMPYTVVLDSDCSYDPIDILEMYKHIDSYDVISASAHHPDASFNFELPWYRLMLSKGVVILYFLATFKYLNSYTSIFRVYDSKLLQSIKIEKDSFVAMTEMLVKLINKKAKVLDFPSDSNYRTFGVSKMRLKSTFMSHIYFLLEIVLDKLRIKKL
jgi:dolichol-phosphate mannosyltransferase